jgi:hypothetical protein
MSDTLVIGQAREEGDMEMLVDSLPSGCSYMGIMSSFLTRSENITL